MKNVKQKCKKPWGSYEVIKNFKVEKTRGSVDVVDNEVLIKKIVVNPKQILSFQRHKKRAEYWTIVQGRGILYLQGPTDSRPYQYPIKSGYTVEILSKEIHSIKNTSKKQDLIFIEISRGEFDEQDIERLADKYNRVGSIK